MTIHWSRLKRRRKRRRRRGRCSPQSPAQPGPSRYSPPSVPSLRSPALTQHLVQWDGVWMHGGGGWNGGDWQDRKGGGGWDRQTVGEMGQRGFFAWSLAAAAFPLGLWFVCYPAALRGRGLMLNPRLGSIQVQAAILDILVDLLSSFQEGVLNVFTSEQTGHTHKCELHRRRLIGSCSAGTGKLKLCRLTFLRWLPRTTNLFNIKQTQWLSH